jgi:hypothetical protein
MHGKDDRIKFSIVWRLWVFAQYSGSDEEQHSSHEYIWINGKYLAWK